MERGSEDTQQIKIHITCPNIIIRYVTYGVIIYILKCLYHEFRCNRGMCKTPSEKKAKNLKIRRNKIEKREYIDS